MFGLIVMVSVSGFIGWLISFYIGIWGIVIAVLVFVFWFRFNHHHSSVGSFKVNLSNYFHYRSQGLPVQDALESMVATRSLATGKNYPSLQMDDALKDLEDLAKDLDVDFTEEEKVTEAVFMIFTIEQGGQTPDMESKYLEQIRQLYREVGPK